MRWILWLALVGLAFGCDDAVTEVTPDMGPGAGGMGGGAGGGMGGMGGGAGGGMGGMGGGAGGMGGGGAGGMGGGGAGGMAGGTTIIGEVVDLEGRAIADAAVNLGEASTTTDARGRFELPVASDAAGNAQAKADGYLIGNRPIEAGGLERVTTRFTLSRMAPGVPIDATLGGVVNTPDGASLDVPAGALVDGEGNAVDGVVDVHLTPLDPRDSEELAAIPTLMAENDAEETVALKSFGVMDVTIMQDDEELDIAEDTTVAATIPFPPAAEPPPDRVPLWSFDEEKGIWVEEGETTYEDGAWSADLPHLSYWNADQPLDDDTCLRGRVLDNSGDPAPGIHVRGESPHGSVGGLFTEAITDGDGRYCIVWQKGQRAIIVADSGRLGEAILDVTAGQGDVGALPLTCAEDGCLDVDDLQLPAEESACEASPEACDDGNPCTTDTCVDNAGAAECSNTPLAAGELCAMDERCDGDGRCVPCLQNDHCDDGDACTTNRCVDNACVFDACNVGKVYWNALSSVPPVATAAAPYSFRIPVEDDAVNVRFWRSEGRIKSYTPPSTRDGTFASDCVRGVDFGWDGTFPYIDILNPVRGDINFDFGETASAALDGGADWRYVIGVGGGGGEAMPGANALVATADRDLEYIGRFNAFGGNVYAQFTAPRTITSANQANLANADGISFFLLGADVTDISITLTQNEMDQHGWVVGVLNIGVQECAGEGAARACRGNECGDGIVRMGEACDDGNVEDGDGCSAACEVEAGSVCTGVLRSNCHECIVDADCSDDDGCTNDRCVDNSCTNVACSRGEVHWNDLARLGGAYTEAEPYRFTIPVSEGRSVDATFWRSAGNVARYVPPSTNNGSFDSENVPGIDFGWEGTFPYIDILNPVQGTLHFDFGRTAPAILGGGDWRYVVGVGGGGGEPRPNPEALVVTASRDLEYIGRFNAFGGNVYANFAAPRTITSANRAELANADGISFFLLSADATDIDFTLANNPIDQHGYVVGVVNLDVQICDERAQMCQGNRCGDGIVRGDEACDDGNADDGDGCSAACAVEDGFECRGVLRTSCVGDVVCGNGRRDAGEGCDDGNVMAGDGCSADCAVEDNFLCQGSPSTCADCSDPSGMPDMDNDGVRNECDLCPNVAARQTFNWVVWEREANNAVDDPIRGNVGGVAVTYTSNARFRLENGPMSSQGKTFDTRPEFGVPTDRRVVVTNFLAGQNTLTFARAVSDPLLLFASIGSRNVPVDIVFDRRIEIVWTAPAMGAINPATLSEDGLTLSGRESFVIVRVAGNIDSVGFRYTVAENSCDFMFGFGGDDADRDGNGVRDVCE